MKKHKKSRLLRQQETANAVYDPDKNHNHISILHEMCGKNKEVFYAANKQGPSSTRRW